MPLLACPAVPADKTRALPTRNDADRGELEHGVHSLTADTAGGVLNGRRISGYDKAPRNLYDFRA